jgi:hypothetical protein
MSSSDGYRLTAAAEHVGDEFLSHHEFVGSSAIMEKQQPAAEAFLECVPAVAGGGDRNL